MILWPKRANLGREEDPDLEGKAYEVNDRIRDGMLRSIHILAGV
jgi:hypothetical protein